MFISIVLSAVFFATGVFIDGARLRFANSQIQRAGNSALSSLLACYNNELKDQYGLFGVYLDNNSLEDVFIDYFRKNLNIDSQNYLYDYCPEKINIVRSVGLSDKAVFEKQILEFMKYRAPYEIASELINKIDGIKNISKGAELYKRKLETDKQAGDIGALQFSLEEKTQKINSEAKNNFSGLKDKYTLCNMKQDEFIQELSRLQGLYSEEKDEKKKDGLFKELNSVKESISNIAKEKEEIKNTVVEGLKQYKSINFEAYDSAIAITDKKESLLERIDAEIEYTKDNHEGVKELQKSYKESLESTKDMLKEDNASVAAGLFRENINKCDSALNNINGSETEFFKALEGITASQSISYSFNRAKPVDTSDKDIRDDVVYALKQAFKPLDELKSIDSSLLDQLPSRTYYTEDNTPMIWDKLDLNNVDCAVANLGNLSEKQQKFERLVSGITEELYLNKYIMGTFKHDVPMLKGENEKNSYNLRSEDKTKRDALFSRFEVEYVINGNKDEAINALVVKSEILAVRLVSNLIHIYTDSSKTARLSSLAAALSSWNAGLSTPLVQTMLAFSWAMTEALYDMELLAKGEKVMLFKTSEHWRTDLSGTIAKNKPPSIENNPFCLSYQDYLEIFLLLTDKEKKLARVQDLIQLNMGLSSPGFLLGDCKAIIQAETAVSIKNMFITFAPFSGGSKKFYSRSYISKSITMKY